MSQHNSAPPQDKPLVILILVAVGITGPLALFLSPVLIGGFIEYWGLTEQQAGYIVSVEMFGSGVATLPALWWINRINWRIAVVTALSLSIVGNLLTINHHDFIQLIVLRFLTGLSWGSAICVSMVAMGITSQPDRTFSYWVIGELALGAMCLAIAPQLMDFSGMAGIYTMILILQGSLLFFVRILPTHNTKTETICQAEVSGVSGWGYIGLIALFLFYTGIYGIYTFVERMGAEMGFSRDKLGLVLSIATFFGLCGALMASRLTVKISRKLIFIVGGAVFFLSTALMLLFGNLSIFTVAVCLLCISWNFLTPSYMGCVANVDQSGQLMTLANAVVGLGLATGAALAASIVDSIGYSGVIVAGALMTVSSLMLMLRLDAMQRSGASWRTAGAVA